jgi:hypothetical protein
LKYKQAGGKADTQTEDIDGGKHFAFKGIAESNRQVIAKHNGID